MDSLPIEVKGLVCSFVSSNSKRDLSSLSRVNRRWHQVALPVLYHTLTIAFQNKEDLLKILARTLSEPHAQIIKHYTRRLDLVCHCSQIFPAPIDASGDIGNPNPPPSYPDYAPAFFFLEDCLDRVYNGTNRYHRIIFAFYPEKDWELLASLIGRLDHIVELNYAIKDMFPVALHHALQQHHPDCRLNIWTNQPFSREMARLGRHRGVNKDAEGPFAMETLQSSNLHALSVSHIRTNKTFHEHPTDATSYFDAAFPFFLAAPNLKHLQFEYDGSSKKDLPKLRSQWEESARIQNPVPVASLESLCFGSNLKSPCGWEDVFLSLSHLVDLSRLRFLDITLSNRPHLLRNARSIVPNLERLLINMHLHERHYDDLEGDDPEMVEVIQEFNPLQFLTLHGLRTYSALQKILTFHGATLQGLVIESTTRGRKRPDADIGYKYPVMSSDQVVEVAESCPNMVELYLPVKRLGGKPEECNIYRALGKFPRLRTLVLETIYDPRSRSVQYTGHPDDSTLREIFTNAATDVNLVKAMWDLISSNQSSRALKNLRVIPIGRHCVLIEGGDHGRFETSVLKRLGRSFLLTRSLGDDPHVQEIGEINMEQWLEYLPSMSPQLRPKPFEKAMGLLRSIWSDIQWDGTTCILSGWQSFPLET